MAGIGFSVLGIYFSHRGAAADDRFFHQSSCRLPVGSKAPQPVDITSAGVSRQCVRTYGLPVRFTNRYIDRPVTLCLGRNGVCDADHRRDRDSPFPGGGVVLRPGEHKDIFFPKGSLHGFGFDRRYPVTVTVSPSALSSTAFDVIVDRKGHQPATQP
ncbi:hypothetical protein ACQEU6_07545 [Spirillospora sp. CA-108201]